MLLSKTTTKTKNAYRIYEDDYDDDEDDNNDGNDTLLMLALSLNRLIYTKHGLLCRIGYESRALLAL
jgi:hypothetical protein